MSRSRSNLIDVLAHDIDTLFPTAVGVVVGTDTDGRALEAITDSRTLRRVLHELGDGPGPVPVSVPRWAVRYLEARP